MLLALAAVVLLGCGSERTDVKTLSDSQAAFLDLVPRSATVEDLILLEPPLWSTRAPRSSAEFLTFQVVPDVVAFKLEAAPDFHIVLRQCW
jgi:hypothetical protein